MEFGRVPESRLNTIDFALPQDHPTTKKILSGKRVASPKVYLGCSKWGRTEWVGKIYPPTTTEKDFLRQYAMHYNSIELNSTHYRIYKPNEIFKWAEKTINNEFLYCPKMYQGITHEKSLYGKELLTHKFLEGLFAFEDQLGPIFVQLSDQYGPSRKIELFEYIKSLPNDLQFFLEVRHPEWFSNEDCRQELFSFLQDHKIGAVITDTSGRRDCAHMQLAIPKAFIRYVGNSLHPTDYIRIDEWIERIKHWIEDGIEEVYFFMHINDEAYFPELAVYMVDKLNAACGLNLKKPEFVKKAWSLF